MLPAGWSDEARRAVEVVEAKPARLWSFEVKLSLGRGSLREAPFQAVSNSTGANFGYLVAAEILEVVEAELRMLSALYGAGVILLDAGTPRDSRILLPARERIEVDWDNLDRLAGENDDARQFLIRVRHFHLTGDPRKEDWL